MFVRIEASSTYNEMINKLIRVVKKKRAAVIQACSPHSTELGIDLPLPSGHEGFALKNEIVAPCLGARLSSLSRISCLMATTTPRILLHSVAAGTMLYGYLSLPRIGNFDQWVKSQYGQSRSPVLQ
jgi:hypothetical protein